MDSVIPSLSSDVRLIVVDDGSDDETEQLCRAVADAHPDRVRLIRRPKGGGFCRAANHGIRETSAEMVVVLNSDTIVVGDWVDRLKNCMNIRPEVGIVGPLSNAASWQSIPEFRNAQGQMAINPVSTDPNTLTQIHEFCSDFRGLYDYPFVELINGFCFAVSRSLLDAIGSFDEDAFPFGYGEENDFCFRACEAGFVAAIAIDCFVYHAKTKSYSSKQRQRLSAAGQKILIDRYGVDRIELAVRSCQRHPVMEAIRGECRKVFPRRGWLVA